ncbi:hypothetical protein [Nonomuraea sp. NPDC049695]|uniref:hypothetical protein n=1 Tax=Nonomuraea sp. NPDC049695 TaxID=3154734 RepID=UPI0034154013
MAVRQIGDTIARIDVIDQGALIAPRVRDPSDTECSGRGLQIVGEIAIRWGVHDDALGGRAVWAEVLTREDASVAVMNPSLFEVEADAAAFPV